MIAAIFLIGLGILTYSLIQAYRYPAEITYIDRQSGQKIQENIPGKFFLKWLNHTILGRIVNRLIMEKKISSVFYGKLMDLPLSRYMIPKFIRDHQINRDECRLPIEDYKTFNQFFYRQLKENARKINNDHRVLCSPADGKVLGWSTPDQMGTFFIKGQFFTLETLLQDHDLAQIYRDGCIYIIRLAPPDYHRYHFPISGRASAAKTIHGRYASVSPLSTQIRPTTLATNERQITRISSSNFGNVMMIEVGATFVGSIVQTFTPDMEVEKGMEKGYFKFGGSTIILLAEPDRILIDPDIVENTQHGYETSIRMGESIGHLLSSGTPGY